VPRTTLGAPTCHLVAACADSDPTVSKSAMVKMPVNTVNFFKVSPPISQFIGLIITLSGLNRR